MSGIFGKMFDFNQNGKLEAGELAAELLFFDTITKCTEDDESDDPMTACEEDDDDTDFDDD
jgi:hypothetical protein